MWLVGRKNMYKIDGKRVFLEERLVFEATEEQSIIQHGRILVVKHGEKYDLYVASNDSIYCIYDNADDYKCKSGLLFAKYNQKYWIAISAHDFAIDLTEKNITSKKSKLLHIPISGEEELEIINVEQFSALFNLGNKGYKLWGRENEKQIHLKEIGKIEELPIAYMFKSVKEHTECFVDCWGSNRFGEFAKIESFKENEYPMLEGHYGYWGKDNDNNICLLLIGADKNNGGGNYYLQFDLPAQKVDFCARYFLNEKRTAAIDVWKVTSNGKEEFVFKTIGRIEQKDILFVIPKEDLFNC